MGERNPESRIRIQNPADRGIRLIPVWLFVNDRASRVRTCGPYKGSDVRRRIRGSDVRREKSSPIKGSDLRPEKSSRRDLPDFVDGSLSQRQSRR
jgi:hypothetical protein